MKLDLGKDVPDIRLKLENLQPTNAYKLRGARERCGAMLSDGSASAACGPSARAMQAKASRTRRAQAGVPCKVVVIDTAPQTKIERMQALGAELVMTPFDVCWRALEEHAFPGMDGTLVHPFDDHNFIAGHGSYGLGDSGGRPD